MNLEPVSEGRLEHDLAERKGKVIPPQARNKEENSEQVCLTGSIESSPGEGNSVSQSNIHEKQDFLCLLSSLFSNISIWSSCFP